ncbi:hypothetical protein [Tsukamurella sp. NPDC003166]|uniref:hypothetical protein n=1 Tax=Tsukamurella sp. NPDC003166 TaxID=3154444 RepID=UPI0033A9AA84
MTRREQQEARVRAVLAAAEHPTIVAWIERGLVELERQANRPWTPGGPREPAAWTPAPDPAHTAPPNRSILRDLWVLVRAAGLKPRKENENDRT